jgi:selenide,water dikinase
LRHLPPIVDPNALVGVSTSDDAAVYRVADALAIVATIDYITPVVDDPFVWGTVAAANALSDVYAMGARPILALNVVNFPRDVLPLEVLEQVLAGGASKTTEAGIGILGGHSIDDPEPKYGLVVLGTIRPERIVRNQGARPGDELILTKPIGIGIITTAIKRDVASAAVADAAVDTMAALNRAASEAMLASRGVHAATDVTGFGLLGHLSEMLGTELDVQLEYGSVPVLVGVRELIAQDVVPGGTRRNLASVEALVDWPASLASAERLLLADAQTSGGLLIAVDPSATGVLLADLRQRGVSAATRIGRFLPGAGRIQVA